MWKAAAPQRGSNRVYPAGGSSNTPGDGVGWGAGANPQGGACWRQMFLNSTSQSNPHPVVGPAHMLSEKLRSLLEGGALAQTF